MFWVRNVYLHYMMCVPGEMGDRGSRGPTVRGPKGQPGPPGLPGENILPLNVFVMFKSSK